MKERATPDAPDPGKRRPHRAPLCRLHSTQSHLARAGAVGLVTGLHARTPRTHSQWVAGPRSHARRTGGRAWQSAQPRTPHTQARGVPPRAPSCRPHTAQSQLVRARTGGWVTVQGWGAGQGRAPNLGHPTPKQEAPPRGRPGYASTALKASSQEQARPQGGRATPSQARRRKDRADPPGAK